MKVLCRRYIRFLLPFGVLALFVGAVSLLHRELAGYHLHDIVENLDAIPRLSIVAAIALTCLNYTILVGYDLVATRFLGHRLPLRKVAFASFLGYVSSNNFGSLLGSTTMRYRLYSGWGLSSLDIVKLIGLLTLSFWLGLFAFAGVVFVIDPLSIPARIPLPFANVRPIGFGLLGLVGVYLALGVFRREPLRMRGWELRLPPWRVSVAQILISSADLAVAAGVLYLLLPRSMPLSYPQFVGVYLLAIVTSVFSNVPGGLGVFELVIVVFSGSQDPHVLLGSLLVFRLVYYLLPLAIGAVVWAGYEMSVHRRHVARLAEGLRAIVPSLGHRLLPPLVFLAGAVLLFSGALPADDGRLAWLGDIVPLPVLEVSHFLGSVMGVCLLLLARGLQRRLDSAYWLAMAMLALGAAFSLLKGFDYEEAAILLLMLGLMIPARQEFHRKGAFFRQALDPGWTAAVLVVVACSVWIGMFAYKHVEYSGELWWHFSLRGDAPRFMRATSGVAVVLLVAAVARLLRPSVPSPVLPGPEQLELAARIAYHSPSSSACLALMGDKELLFDENRTAYIMYGISGRNWIAMGDPVGPPEAAEELAWKLRELSDCFDARVSFYQVGEESLPLYLDLGLSLLKLGEEARVPLPDFTLEGSSRRSLRQTWNRYQRQDCSFDILTPQQVRQRIDELKHVSDAWLSEKNAAEKRFSLGFFSADYIARCPVAIVHREGTILAFANLWAGQSKEEMSIDLMRYTSEAPAAVMEYLFTQLMFWGREQGYQWFSLGMAPLSGFENHELAPIWSRFGNLVFRHGEHFYNFQGLRQYKEKFQPQWRPRYLASPGGLALPLILKDISTMISGGLVGLVRK
ncbi:MAG: bifunctional lysylphosphatidylglycerol flippase/synthetase MprF [Thermoguttaceae bacterium]